MKKKGKDVKKVDDPAKVAEEEKDQKVCCGFVGLAVVCCFTND